MTPRTEQQLLDAVIDLATISGWLCHHDRPARRSSAGWATHITGEAGFPDLVLARRGVVIFRELKAFDSRGRLGVLSSEQRDWAKQLLPTWTACREHADSMTPANAAEFRAGLLFDVWTPDDWPLIVPTLTAKIGARA